MGRMGPGMQQGMGMGQMHAAGAAAGMAADAPGAAMGAFSLGAFTMAPMMAQGGRGLGTRMAGSAWQWAGDPFKWMGGAYRAGAGLGGRAAGESMMGMAGRVGARGAMGSVGLGIAAGSGPLAAGIAATMAVEYGGKRMFEGAAQTMMGTSTLRQMQTSMGGERANFGQGAQFGKEMGTMAEEMGVETKDIQKFVQQANQMRMFQTTSSVKEFRAKFKEVMSAVKEISLATQETLDDAMKTFGDLRQQGFYTTADITAQAAKNKAREIASGMSQGQLQAVGQMGAQMARAQGMRGRVGADLAQQNVTAVSQAVRTGQMDEELVEEMGGVEAVGLRQSQRQMSFLRTSRGRALIAATMGKEGGPDLQRMTGLLQGGMTTESIVTGAAGRGIGILRRAGSKESREQYAPYAGMMMVQMAASQQRQLYGGVSARGIQGMLGTMGVGRDESKLMLQQAMAMPDVLRRQEQAATQAAQEAKYEEMRREQSLTGKVSRFFRSETAGLADIGREVATTAAGAYGAAAETLTGQRRIQVTGATREMARAGRESRRDRPTDIFEGGDYKGETGGGMFGPSSIEERLRSQYAEGIIQGPGTEDKLRYAEKREEKIMEVGEGQYLTSGMVQKLDRARSEARAPTEDEVARLKMAARRGDVAEFTGEGMTNTAMDEWFEKRRSGLSDEEFRTYKTAQMMGTLPPDVGTEKRGLEAFRKLSPEERAGLRETAARASAEAGVPELVKSADRDAAMGMLSQERLRKETDEKIEGFMRKSGLGTMGPVGLKYQILGTGGNIFRTLASSSEAKLSMTKLLQNWDDMGPAERERELKKMEDAGMSEAAVRDIQEKMEDEDSRNEMKKQWLGGDEVTHGVKSYVEEQALRDIEEPRKQREGKAADKYLDVFKVGEEETLKAVFGRELGVEERKRFRGLGEKIAAGAKSGADREKAWQDVYTDLLKDQELSTEEQAALLNLGGMGGLRTGMGIESALKTIGGKEGDMDKALADLGLSEEQRKKVKATVQGTEGKEAQGAALLKELSDAGVMNEGLYSAGDGGKGESKETSIAGVMAEYMKWNTKYVMAVNQTLTMLKNVPGMDKLIGDIPADPPTSSKPPVKQ